MRSNNQNMKMAQHKAIFTQSCPQPSKKSVLHGKTCSSGEWAQFEGIRVSTVEANAQTQAGNIISLPSRSKNTNAMGRTMCSGKAEPRTQAAVARGGREAAYGVVGGPELKATQITGGGLGTVENRRGVARLRRPGQRVVQGRLRGLEKEGCTPNTLGEIRRTQETRGSVVGTKQGGHGKPLDCRPPHNACALGLANGTQLEARKPAYIQPLKCGTDLAATPSARPSAIRASSATWTRPCCPFSKVPLATHDCEKRAHISQDPLNSFSHSKKRKEPSSHQAGETRLSASSAIWEISPVHTYTLTVCSKTASTTAYEHYGADGDEAAHAGSDGRLSPANPLSSTMLLQSSAEEVLPKGTWTACKPFPKRETVVQLEPRVKFSGGEGGATIPEEILELYTGARPGIETHEDSEFPPPRWPACVSNCPDVGEQVCEQQAPLPGEVNRVTAAQEDCQTSSKQRAEVWNRQPLVWLDPASRHGQQCSARSVNATVPAKPLAHTCASRNMFSPAKRPMSFPNCTTFPGHTLHARVPAANPYPPTNLGETGKVSKFCIQGKTESFSNHGQNAVPRCAQAEGNLFVSKNGCVAPWAAEVWDVTNQGKLSQPQQQREQDAPMSRISRPLTSTETTNLRSLGLTVFGNELKDNRLALAGGEDAGDQLRISTSKSIPGDERVHQNVPTAEAWNAEVQSLDTASTSDSDSSQESLCSLPEGQSPSALKALPHPFANPNPPDKRPFKRHPLVPPLPLHLLPEILARKDAEERAYRRAHCLSFDESETDESVVRVRNQQKQSPGTPSHSVSEDSSLDSNLPALGSRPETDSPGTVATSTSLRTPSSQQEELPRTCPQIENLIGKEEAYTNCLYTAPNHTSSNTNSEVSSNHEHPSVMPWKINSSSPRTIVEDHQIREDTPKITPRITLPAGAHSHTSTLASCSSNARRTKSALTEEYDVDCKGFERYILPRRRENSIRPPRRPEEELVPRSESIVGLLGERLPELHGSTFAIVDPVPTVEVAKPEKTLDEQVVPKLVGCPRDLCGSGAFSLSTTHHATKEACTPSVKLPHQDMSISRLAPLQALDVTVKPGSERQPQQHPIVSNIPASFSVNPCQMIRNFTKERVILTNTACPRSSVAVSQPLHQALAETHSQPKNEAFPSLQPPCCNACSHNRCAAAHSGDAPKREPGLCISTLSHVERNTLADAHERLQQAMPKSQSGSQRLLNQLKVQHPPQKCSSATMTACKTLAEGNKQPEQLRQKQAARSVMRNIPPSMQGGVQEPAGSHVMSGLQGVTEKSGSEACQQNSMTKPALKACQRSPQTQVMGRALKGTLPRTRTDVQMHNGSQVLPPTGNSVSQAYPGRATSAVKACQSTLLKQVSGTASNESLPRTRAGSRIHIRAHVVPCGGSATEESGSSPTTKPNVKTGQCGPQKQRTALSGCLPRARTGTQVQMESQVIPGMRSATGKSGSQARQCSAATKPGPAKACQCTLPTQVPGRALNESLPKIRTDTQVQIENQAVPGVRRGTGKNGLQACQHSATTKLAVRACQRPQQNQVSGTPITGCLPRTRTGTQVQVQSKVVPGMRIATGKSRTQACQQSATMQPAVKACQRAPQEQVLGTGLNGSIPTTRTGTHVRTGCHGLPVTRTATRKSNQQTCQHGEVTEPTLKGCQCTPQKLVAETVLNEPLPRTRTLTQVRVGIQRLPVVVSGNSGKSNSKRCQHRAMTKLALNTCQPSPQRVVAETVLDEPLPRTRTTVRVGAGFQDLPAVSGVMRNNISQTCHDSAMTKPTLKVCQRNPQKLVAGTTLNEPLPRTRTAVRGGEGFQDLPVLSGATRENVSETCHDCSMTKPTLNVCQRSPQQLVAATTLNEPLPRTRTAARVAAGFQDLPVVSGALGENISQTCQDCSMTKPTLRACRGSPQELIAETALEESLPRTRTAAGVGAGFQDLPLVSGVMWNNISQTRQDCSMTKPTLRACRGSPEELIADTALEESLPRTRTAAGVGAGFQDLPLVSGVMWNNISQTRHDCSMTKPTLRACRGSPQELIGETALEKSLPRTHTATQMQAGFQDLPLVRGVMWNNISQTRHDCSMTKPTLRACRGSSQELIGETALEKSLPRTRTAAGVEAGFQDLPLVRGVMWNNISQTRHDCSKTKPTLRARRGSPQDSIAQTALEESLPRTRTAERVEAGSHGLHVVRSATGGCIPQTPQENAITKMRAKAGQGSPRLGNNRVLRHDSKHHPIKSAQEPPFQLNKALHVTQLFPSQSHLLRVHHGQGSQRPAGLTVQLIAVPTASAVSAVQGKTATRLEKPHLYEASAQQELSNMRATTVNDLSPSGVMLSECPGRTGVRQMNKERLIEFPTLRATATCEALSSLPLQPDTHLPRVKTSLQHESRAVSRRPRGTGARDPGCAFHSSDHSSLGPSTNGAVTQEEFCSPAVGKRLQRPECLRANQQRPADPRSYSPIDVDTSGVPRQRGSLSRMVQLHQICPALNTAIVEGEQQKQGVTAHDTRGQETIIHDYDVPPAVRQHVVEGQSYLRVAPSSYELNEPSTDTSEAPYVTVSQMANARQVIPLEHRNFCGQLPTQVRPQRHSAAQLPPSLLVVGRPEKTAAGLSHPCKTASRGMRPNLSEADPSPVPAKGVHFNSRQCGAPVRLEPSQLCPVSWQQRLSELRELPPRERVALNAHVGLNMQQSNLPQGVYQPPADALSAANYSHAALQLIPSQRVFAYGLTPAAVACRQ